MKKLLILIFLFPVLLPAQEKYFHELKGMEDSTLGFPYPIFVKQSLNRNYGFPSKTLITRDSIYLQLDNHTVPLSIDAKDWPDFGYDYDKFISFLDSASINVKLTFIHPKIDSLYYAINGGNSYLSESFTSDFQLSDSPNSFSKLRFDAKSSVIYSFNSNSIQLSNNYGKLGSWSKIQFPEQLKRLQYFDTDAELEGNLFLSDSTCIFQSSDFGSSFELISEMEYKITGLYKKPGSDILYVLTTDELFEVNTDTKAVTSLKKLPVSNEKEPEEIPSSIKLHQNYPNPFNPSTTISFELDNPTKVTLTIFDALGRTISVLLDDRRTSGLHEISFDASGLSSGIYFYRLETGAFFETKRFTLIK